MRLLHEDLSCRYEEFEYSTASHNSEVTLCPETRDNDNITVSSNCSINSLQIPIVGYEIMEERAKFTVRTMKFDMSDSDELIIYFRCLS